MPRRTDPLPDNAPHVLVVDDDQRIRDLLSRYLVDNGFRVTSAADAANARASMRGLAFDLVVLDVMMPGEDGLSLAKSLKEISSVPICMLTARAETSDRIKGLEIGVDEYITKPFEPRELVLRLQNILRRARGGGAVRDEVKMGEFSFSLGRGELRRGEETIKLTGNPVARHELASDDTTGNERAIDVQINRLRRKIETDPSNPIYLQTVRGKGYILYTD
mgnify:CR=1 FL=1